jgi:hypothetical protein
MRPDARNRDLIYVVETESNIYIYSYPRGRIEGVIGDLAEASAECVDKSGDVFVADYLDHVVLEYRHGAISPTRTYDDEGYNPDGCSIDPTTGDLAVANSHAVSSSSSGNIAIYKPPGKKPVAQLSDPHIASMRSCTYDASGNLYVDGLEGSNFAFGVLRSGHHFILGVALTPTVYEPGEIHWDGKHLAVADRGSNTIDRYAMSASSRSGKEVGTTVLDDGSIESFWVQPPNVLTAESTTALGIWRYPGGGAPFKSIVSDYYAGPSVVSLATGSNNTSSR